MSVASTSCVTYWPLDRTCPIWTFLKWGSLLPVTSRRLEISTKRWNWFPEWSRKLVSEVKQGILKRRGPITTDVQQLASTNVVVQSSLEISCGKFPEIFGNVLITYVNQLFPRPLLQSDAVEEACFWQTTLQIFML